MLITHAAPSETQIDHRESSELFRSPSWAQRARRRNREEREAQGIVDEDNEGGLNEGEEVGEEKNLFTSTSGIKTAEDEKAR
jgi:hypothetical protein